MPSLKAYEELEINQQKVYWADYDMVQTEIVFLAKGDNYDAKNAPAVRIFNEYFGGVVFQEIREAQGLAYSVFSRFSQPSKKDKANYLFAYVGTQADKQAEAMNAMMELLNEMPETEEDFKTAKEAILNKIESERITGSGVLWNYISAEDKGVDYDLRKDIYEQVKGMEFQNLKDFHEQFIKYNEYVTVLVGSRDKIDFSALKKYGEINEVSLDELFGYKDSQPVEIK